MNMCPFRADLCLERKHDKKEQKFLKEEKNQKLHLTSVPYSCLCKAYTATFLAQKQIQAKLLLNIEREKFN